MSELKKELEQDKAFIEEVANRIYLDTDDIEESMPESEWIERMTDIADKYITRFETSYNFANNLTNELLASNIQPNENQLIGIIYSQLIEEFTFNYSEKDLWMIAENIYEKIVSQQPKLNDDQKIVLEWLKKDKKYRPFWSIVYLYFANGVIYDLPPKKVYKAYKQLDYVQQFGVLQAFAQWGLKEEEAEC